MKGQLFGLFRKSFSSYKTIFSRNLFTVSLTYKVSLEIVEKHLDMHRKFLENNYQKGIFIASGPKFPRTGGVIIASLPNKEELNKVIEQDPFFQYHVADYEIIEFFPTLHREDFKLIAEKDKAIHTKNLSP